MTVKIPRPTSPRITPLPPRGRDIEAKSEIDKFGSSGTDNTFDTLSRHPRLLSTWMPFSAWLAVESELPPRLRELSMMRTGWHCRSEYEFGQHAVLGRKVGVTDEEIARVKEGPDAVGWSEEEAALLRAADELHEDACISDETWAVLSKHFTERQLIEVPFLAGQYHLVAYILNSLGIEREPGLPGFDA
ncbi:4-carboxymuconolactone decarboxylase [Nocardia sp. GAS34]|uniref:carboxymuconolactone decarboxylase family protein n=1 Tax=Nocardia sp. GAS34 TaxID=3156305 RepID=UPI003D222AC2